MILMYDPPGGWKYGFPKPYKPLKGESLRDTLIRDGYPEKEIISDKENVAKYVRFFGWDEKLWEREQGYDTGE
jgi:hypothetical protein